MQSIKADANDSGDFFRAPAPVFIVNANNGANSATTIWSSSVSAVVSGRLHLKQGWAVTIEGPNGASYKPEEFSSLL